MVVGRLNFLIPLLILAGCAELGMVPDVPPPVYSAATENSVAKYPDDPEMPGVIKYINPDIGELRDPEYPGRYYEAVVPATLDLAERARLATHALTAMTNPKIDHEIFFTVSHMTRPPAMDHNASDLHCHGKFMEVLPLMRVMSGSLENMHVEKKWMEVILKMQGPDGLIYTPTTGRDWILPPNQDVASGSPGSDTFTENHFCLLGFSTARSMAVLSLYAQKDPQGPWADAARRLASAYQDLVITKGDRSHLFSTWMYPGREVFNPVNHPFDEYGYLAGTQAWIAQYLAVYDRALDDPAASKLAERIMNYNMFEMEYNEPNGRFKPSKGVGAGPLAKKNQYAHFHTHAMNILACIYIYMQTGNEKLLDRAVKAYEWGITQGNTRVGFFPMCTYDEYIGAQTAETCQVADMLIAGVTLAKLGYDKWDDVDRWVRNQFSESQLTRVNWLTDGHLDYSRSPVGDGYFDSPRRTTEQVAGRTLGAFAGWPTPNDWVGAEDWEGGDKQNKIYTIMNCCTGSGCRGLYSVWRDMISFKEDTLRVHLLLNRASKWADIDSYIPYTGRVDVNVKQNLDLQLRIPEWVKPAEVECTVDGNARDLAFDGRYARVGKVGGGEKVVMMFPISERTEKHTIEGFDYNFVLRGNDVVLVDPPGKYAPMYQRGHYRAGKPLYRKVTRFVSEEDYPWW
jgi:hypothetical protein